MRKLRRHLDEHGFADIAIRQLGGEHAARTDPDAPFVRMVAEAAEGLYDRPMVLAPLSGGTGPMYPFVEHLGMPIANSGVATPDTNVHAPNEFVEVAEFLRGAKHAARILARMPDV